jgi:vacuolar protein sorting-associated protein IST1
MREERLVCAYEILDLFSELLLQRLAVIEKAKGVPPELAEAIATVVYVAARCAEELPELAVIRGQLAAKYGAAFVAAACAEPPPASPVRGLSAPASSPASPASPAHAAPPVNERVVALLAVTPPPPALKLTRLGEIAAEHNVPFDASAASSSILGAAAPDLVDVDTTGVWAEQPGPHMAAPLPQAAAVQAAATLVDGWFQVSSPPDEGHMSAAAPAAVRVAAIPPLTPLPARQPVGGEQQEEEYADAASAARCAARSAEKAAHAASAAARLAGAAAPLPTPAPAPAAPPAPRPAERDGSDAGDAADEDDAGVGAQLPSTPSSTAKAPATATPPPPPSSPPQAPPPAAAAAVDEPTEEVDELDELTRRFEALKRRM